MPRTQSFDKLERYIIKYPIYLQIFNQRFEWSVIIQRYDNFPFCEIVYNSILVAKSWGRYSFPSAAGIPLFGQKVFAKRINPLAELLVHAVSLPRIVYLRSSTINHSVNEVLAITLGKVSNEGHPVISGTWIQAVTQLFFDVDAAI